MSLSFLKVIKLTPDNRTKIINDCEIFNYFCSKYDNNIESNNINKLKDLVITIDKWKNNKKIVNSNITEIKSIYLRLSKKYTPYISTFNNEDFFNWMENRDALLKQEILKKNSLKVFLVNDTHDETPDWIFIVEELKKADYILFNISNIKSINILNLGYYFKNTKSRFYGEASDSLLPFIKSKKIFNNINEVFENLKFKEKGQEKCLTKLF